jgi:hypothetical protein
MSKRMRRGREFWTKLVAEFEAGGGKERHESFAGRHGVRRESFERWLYRIRAEKAGRRWLVKRGRRAPGARASMPLVEVSSALLGDGRFEIELRSGVRLRVPERFEVDGLRRLLAVLDEKAS